MKLSVSHIFPLFLLLVALCSGCRRLPQYPAELLRIDSVTNLHPDSALTQLEGMAHRMAEAEEPVRHYYQLLLVKAQDKAQHSHTSDSTILAALHYYEEGGDLRLLPEAYYYAGRVMRVMGDAPQALDYFQQALDVMEQKDFKHLTAAEESKYRHLQGVVYAQMGYLFRRQHLYDKAIEAMRQTYDLMELNHDTAVMIQSLCDIGQTYQSQALSEEAIHYYILSEELATQAHDTVRLYTAICQEAFTLARTGRYQEAASRLALCENISQTKYNSLYTYVKAYYYYGTNQRDSAFHYLSIIEQTGTSSQKAQSELWLAEYELVQSHTEKAIDRLKKYIEYSTEEHQQQNAEDIGLTNALYNYQLRERENHCLKLQHSQDRQAFIVTIASIILLLLLTLFLLYLIRQNRQKSQLQQQRLQQLYDAKAGDAAALEENARQIRLLQQQLSDSASNCDSLQQELSDLMALNRQSEMAESFDTRWRTTEECRIIDEHILQSKPLQSDDWKRIEAKIRRIHPMFMSRLRAVYDFSDIEWKISLLIRLHITPGNIGLLTSRTNAAVGNARKRLFRKVMQREGAAEDWDKFILEL